jgi:hypothetical protein
MGYFVQIFLSSSVVLSSTRPVWCSIFECFLAETWDDLSKNLCRLWFYLLHAEYDCALSIASCLKLGMFWTNFYVVFGFYVGKINVRFSPWILDCFIREDWFRGGLSLGRKIIGPGWKRPRDDSYLEDEKFKPFAQRRKDRGGKKQGRFVMASSEQHWGHDDMSPNVLPRRMHPLDDGPSTWTMCPDTGPLTDYSQKLGFRQVPCGLIIWYSFAKTYIRSALLAILQIHWLKYTSNSSHPSPISWTAEQKKGWVLLGVGPISGNY